MRRERPRKDSVTLPRPVTTMRDNSVGRAADRCTSEIVTAGFASAKPVRPWQRIHSVRGRSQSADRESAIQRPRFKHRRGRPICHGHHVCASGKSATASFCPLSPTFGLALGVNSTVGERVGVRGPHRSPLAPHPGPLPTAISTQKVASPVGRGGRRRGLSTFWRTHGHQSFIASARILPDGPLSFSP